MSVLKMIDVEKHCQDRVIFPSFQLEVAGGNVIALLSSTDVRQALLNMVAGKELIYNGEIWIKNKKITRNRSHFSELGVLFLNEGVYERLCVKDHLLFYKRLYDSKLTMESVYQLTQLSEKKYAQVKELSYSEVRRLQTAKLLFGDPSLFILEEPDQNVDLETKGILLNIISFLQKKGKGIVVLTGNMESAITLTDKIYRLDEKGLQEMDMKDDRSGKEETDLLVERNEVPIPMPFQKIPTKVNEKIILFDPSEVDYIESYSGQSHVHIGEEAFPCVFTLNKLEAKLTSFGFFRCHRSYIVNLQKVREVITWTRNSYSLKLENKVGSEIPLSKNKMAELKDLLELK
ncbi:LytTR family transcriptional regulator DNA-binding domain-containing protein [Melghirimyces algeriensis]|uniref:Transcriptional regulator, LytTR family n=1 Tax=Melghirimyces algeriensis TaxID=910412 RepID=A0A521AXA0_9BACL|nr:LytTR family transcriptional regulator DNA-binding domain-containing protein [Melghirimyces algeriensis]SMO39419.1 transcriptional regulator, LytTR family [Melghirimyces algeriensis]